MPTPSWLFQVALVSLELADHLLDGIYLALVQVVDVPLYMEVLFVGLVTALSQIEVSVLSVDLAVPLVYDC